MKCSQFQLLQFGFFEKTLNSHDMEDAAAHVASCSQCSEFVRAYQLTTSQIQADREAHPDPFAVTRIMQRIDYVFYNTQSASFFSLKKILQPALLTLAVLFGLLIGWFQASRHQLANDRMTNNTGNLEQLRTDLYITEFADEDNLLNLNK